MQKRIVKEVDFCAAHSIKGAGKCSNKHGHNWQATITVDLIGGELDERGFVVDVRDLKEAAYKYDHDDLDRYFEYPSTENVAQKIADDALEVCKENNLDATYIVNVHLVETKNNSAFASASNFTAALPEAPQITLAEQKLRAEQAETNYAFGGTQPPVAKNKFIKRVK